MKETGRAKREKWGKGKNKSVTRRKTTGAKLAQSEKTEKQRERDRERRDNRERRKHIQAEIKTEQKQR